ncbi:MAG TPA: peptidylprolyl isomerase, partial [Bacteroidales bacterium]|nr:peptidylprolyl isomerase [Bacteroidales bacterium]
FQMITPFENAAYSLKKNEISKPVRTPYGYHIIKLADIRPSKGKVRVAHIMKNVPPGSDESIRKKAEEDINLIYEKLRSGIPFNKLASEYSDHKQTASKGGELEWFGTGEIISDFSEAAFSLKDTGTYSKPVLTPYGYHIIKLLEKRAPQSYDDIKPFLESRINKSYLNSVSKKSFIDKLKKEYNFNINRASFDWFVHNTDTLIIQGLKKYDRAIIPEGNIYYFKDQSLSNTGFANYIEKRGNIIDTRDSAAFITLTLETRSSDHLISFENSLLEKKNPEFRYLMNEFHDGILMFEVSADKIWNPVSEDTSRLIKYYEDNKSKYLSEPGIEAKIYTLREAGGQQTLTSFFKKYSRKSNYDALLLKKFNRKNDSLLVITEGRWFKGQDKTLDNLEWVTGNQPCIFNGFPSIVVINKLIDSVPIAFELVEENVVNSFQEYLENTWLKQLKERYTVKVDNSVLSEVKKKLGK